jgi:predicted nucleic acid-binding protein
VVWHYLDASAMVKIIADDPDEDRGREALRDYYRANSMYRASSFCVAEALSAFKLKWLRKRCTQDEYFGNVRKFFSRVVSPLHMEECPLALQVQEEAERVMQAYNLDFVDSIQIVTLLKGRYAGLVGSSRSILITADQALAAAARQEGARVWDCTSEPAPS